MKKNPFVLAGLVLCALSAGAETQPLVRTVPVAGGTYLQGSLEQPYASTERVHLAALPSFEIAATETTQELWLAVMGTNPSKFRAASRPVESVSWMDAVRFCNALSLREGLRSAYRINGTEVEWDREADGYRLPTEAEWEYAARGGSAGADASVPLAKAPYAGGVEADRVAWYDKNSAKSTHPVGMKQENGLGLFDMSGNVWEWCWDWYAEYPKTEVSDPAGPLKGAGQKVLRGGAWFTPVNLLRVTYRYWNVPGFKVNSVGFRVARNAPASEALDEVAVGDGSKLDAFDFLAIPASESPR
jgi:formylglycine-generating enzyme required for sulfatase activity